MKKDKKNEIKMSCSYLLRTSRNWIPGTSPRMTECGRSMVEMLGALAVMGGLFVGGSASAMNKHPVNEILNEASKIAVMVAGQLVIDPTATTISLSQFGTNTVAGATFGENATISNGKIILTISGVESAVCTQMKNAVGTNTPIRKINDTCTELTFNNDMSTRDIESECSINPETDCLSKALVEGECACAPAAEGTECTSWTTNECGKGRYCNFDLATYTTSGSCSSDPNNYYTSVGPGTCADISGVSEPNATDKATLTDAGFSESFVTSGTTKMRWWSAASWCLGQGKHLIDVSKMECYAGGDTLVVAGDTWAYCCKNGRSCQQRSWDELWSENAPKDEDATAEIVKSSEKIVALRQVYGSAYFWTASPYGNTSPNSCYAFGVSLYSGSVIDGNRSDGGNYYALCE